MTNNEAIRLGEEVRNRIEEIKQKKKGEDYFSFESLLELMSKLSQKISSQSSLNSHLSVEQENEWKDALKKAFAVDELHLDLKFFTDVKDMELYILEVPKGNSYIRKKSNDSEQYEIGIVNYFDIIGLIHEIAHIVQNDFTEAIMWNSFEQNDEEKSANVFSRSFWMPKRLFEKYVLENSVYGECDINSVAKCFCIDNAQVYLRGKELCLWI